MKSCFLSAVGCLSALASATGGAVVHVDARNPAEALRLRFEGGSGVTELGLRPDDTWAHPELQVTGGEKSRGVFRSDSDADGAVAHAHLHCTSDCFVDFALISRAGSILLALNGTLPGRQGTLPSPDAHPIRHGRRAQLQLPAPPYVRLSNCDWAGVKTLTLGLAIDKGFVAAVGGTDAAMTEAASAVSRANFVYEGQLGVRLLVTHVVINSDDAPVGQAPDVPGSRDTCEEYFPREIEGHGLTVQADDIEAALDLFSWWVGCGGGGCDGIAGAPVEPAEGPALWHLLTDCFPSPGVVGIAGLRAVCNAPRRIEFRDSGIPARRPGQADDACDVVVQSTGNCASKFATEPCDSEDKICTANTAVSSWSRRGSFWHTFAHEIGHNLGGEHTFGYDSNGNFFDFGGLMSYPAETAFYDQGDVCRHLKDTLDTVLPSGQCLASSEPECGNGKVEAGEECDDGDDTGGDGCSANCEVECGYLCEERLTASGLTASNCTLGCGNGQVDVLLREECDAPGETCCSGECRLAADKECCGGECCDDDGQFKTTADSCDGGSGYCSQGECVPTAQSRCVPYGYIVDADACPQWDDQPCIQRCFRPATGNTPARCDQYLFPEPNLHLNYLPDNTPCLPTQDAGVQGVCLGGLCKAIQLESKCITPALPPGPPNPPPPPGLPPSPPQSPSPLPPPSSPPAPPSRPPPPPPPPLPPPPPAAPEGEFPWRVAYVAAGCLTLLTLLICLAMSASWFCKAPARAPIAVQAGGGQRQRASARRSSAAGRLSGRLSRSSQAMPAEMSDVLLEGEAQPRASPQRVAA